MQVNFNTAIPSIPIKQFSIQSKILSSVAFSICSIAAILLYDKIYWIHAADGGKCPLPRLSDKFNHYMCIDSRWHKAAYWPLGEMNERLNACVRGEKIAGCINGEYFHNLSEECLKNPTGYYCEKITSWKGPFEEFNAKNKTV